MTSNIALILWCQISMLYQHYGTTAPSLRSHWRIHNCKRKRPDALRSWFNRQLLSISTQSDLKQPVQLATARYFHPNPSFAVKTAKVWSVCTFWKADCTLLHPTCQGRAAAIAWWAEATEGSWLRTALSRAARTERGRTETCTAAANITSESLYGVFVGSSFWSCMKRNSRATG